MQRAFSAVVRFRRVSLASRRLYGRKHDPVPHGTYVHAYAQPPSTHRSSSPDHACSQARLRSANTRRRAPAVGLHVTVVCSKPVLFVPTAPGACICRRHATVARESGAPVVKLPLFSVGTGACACACACRVWISKKTNERRAGGESDGVVFVTGIVLAHPWPGPHSAATIFTNVHAACASTFAPNATMSTTPSESVSRLLAGTLVRSFAR